MLDYYGPNATELVPIMLETRLMNSQRTTKLQLVSNASVKLWLRRKHT